VKICFIGFRVVMGCTFVTSVCRHTKVEPCKTSEVS
jgi:hypothetical protein